MGKLTVGKYSPEKAVQNYLHGSSKLITDSFSYLSGTDPPRSPQAGAASPTSERVDTGKGLMLDQYLTIHTYSGQQDGSGDLKLNTTSRGSPGRLGMAVMGEFDGPSTTDGSRKNSPTRVDVPLLRIGSNSPGEAQHKANPDATPHIAPHTKQATPQEAQRPLDSAGNKINFDDSAPTTAIPGIKKPTGAELTKQLSSIPDVPGSKAASPRHTGEHTGEHTPVRSRAPTPKDFSNEARRSRPWSPFDQAQGANDSPVSTKSALELDSHLDWGELLDAPVPKAVSHHHGAAGVHRPSSPVQSIVVKVEGSMVSQAGAERVAHIHGVDSKEHSARSLGLDSLSGELELTSLRACR